MFVNHNTKSFTYVDPRFTSKSTNTSEQPSTTQNSTINTPPPSRNIPLQQQQQQNLPPGWQTSYDANGRLYYVDHNTKTTTYTDPRLCTQAPPPPIPVLNTSTSTGINMNTMPQTTSSRNVVVNNIKLTDSEVSMLGGMVMDGNYWYDHKCGAWGYMGGPCLGIVQPNLAIVKGKMPSNASNGNSGVYINGRQLHADDVATFARLGITCIPGHWWVDSNGSFGLQHIPIPMGNLFALAKQKGHTSSPYISRGLFGTYGSDSSGNYYISLPGGSSVANF